MDLIIIITILSGLVVHRELSSYQEFGQLKNEAKFLLITFIFFLLVAINYIWLFGIIEGIILFVLTFYQVIYSAFLWPFLVYGTIKRNRRVANVETIEDVNKIITETKPLNFVIVSWPILVSILIFLTIVNFVVGSYASIYNSVLELLNNSRFYFYLILLIGIIVGNLIRVIVLKFILRNTTKNNQLKI